ncbi:hypothetical protein GM526_17710 [Enterococcus avium]|uniref:hypothetical protein n=1 Tax=Enterococcus avium TaxID=33945 RepID=UPI00159DDC7D|nr:hypothetical protein [Enterococcus avium]NVN78897.1 hypothetical protein [Enterococcus avium]
MKIYKVFVSEEIQDTWDGNWWDEYFGHVVVADDEQEALKIALSKGLMVPENLVTVEEVDSSKKGIVMSDFNAG